MLTVCKGQLMRLIVSYTAKAGLEIAPGTLKYMVMGSLLLSPCSQISEAINWFDDSSSKNRPTNKVRSLPKAL